MEWTYSLSQIEETAGLLLAATPGSRVYALHGQLGAGKTSFVHALCQRLKVNDAVASPTFSIINQYESPEGSIYHIDLYRLSDAAEAIRAGVEDCLYSGDLCLVEWPERAPEIFPAHTRHIYFEILDEQTRKLRLES